MYRRDTCISTLSILLRSFPRFLNLAVNVLGLDPEGLFLEKICFDAMGRINLCAHLVLLDDEFCSKVMLL